MENILLIIVVVFLALMALAGYKKGFLKIILSMAALIVTLVLAAILTPTITGFLKEKTPVYDSIYTRMESFVEGDVEEGNEDSNSSLEELPLPDIIKNALIDNNTGDSYVEMGVNSAKAYTANALTMMLLKAIAFILLFIVISIAFGILIALTSIFTKIPIIKGANKMAGLAAGLLEGIIILWILAMIVTAFGATTWGQSTLRMIDDSVFLSFLYNNNLLTKFITAIF